MKKIFSILVAFFAVFLMSCNNDVSNNSIPNLKKIKDFAKYKSIGAGSISSTRSARSANGSVYIDPEEDVKLIGELSDGSIELIKFIDEEGNIKEQKWLLNNLRAYPTFVFLYFTESKSSPINEPYVLDLKTGNLYSLYRQFGMGVSPMCESFNKEKNKVTFFALHPFNNDTNYEEGIYSMITEEVDGIVKLKISYEYPFSSRFGGEVDIYGNVVNQNVIYSKGNFYPITEQFVLNEFDNKFYSYEVLHGKYFKLYLADENGNITKDSEGKIINQRVGYAFQFIKIGEKTIDSEGNIILNTSEEYPCYIDVNHVIEDDNYIKEELGLKYFKIYKNYSNSLFIQNDYKLEKTETEIDEYDRLEYDVYKLTITDLNLHEVTYNKDGSIAEDKVTPLSEAYSNFKQDTTPVMTNESDTIVSYSGSLEENASVTFYKYNIDTNTTDTILTVDKIYGIEQNNKYIYLYTYDADWHKLEYYIYPDGSVKNEYKDYSNHKIYLVPIA